MKLYLPPDDYNNTLLGELADCVDCWRHISSELGARPYRVFVVKTRWTGKRRGEGIEIPVFEEELTPTPKVDPISAIQQQLQDIGLDEVGTVNVAELSPRYTSNFLMGRDEQGRGIAANESFFWEIVLIRNKANEPQKRRRFMVAGVPAYEANKLQWSVRLVRAGNDREEDGTPR